MSQPSSLNRKASTAIRLGLTDTDPASGLPVENFQPGMVEYLKPGQDVKFNNPPAAGGYREYKMTELQGHHGGDSACPMSSAPAICRR